ncbi:hypothetical protein KO481_21450 [Nocardia sp. NEAU-G5]|uniref:Uncharacterized protein n=1 Tax=Nocardia albiluteola TaxID=2842303 RepID=A0ABS6B1A3_9NOCA|nr:hypothetical protein [Nocardia albiluteola]MBU3064085.1 hypothetical protein [Nocardia albiluteola]
MTQLANYTREPLSVDLPPLQAEPQPDTLPVPYSYAPRVADGTVTARAHDTLERVADQFGKFLATIDPTHYTAEGMHAAIDRFTGSDADKAIDSALDEATALRDTANADAEYERQKLIIPGDAAEESRMSRYWERTRRILDGKNGIDALTPVLTQTIADANPSQLGTLLEELQPYLQSRGITANAHIEAELRRRAPLYVAALKRANAAEKSRQTIQYNAQTLRQRMKTSGPSGWQRPKFVDARTFDPDR